VSYARQFALPFPQHAHYEAADFLAGACNEAAQAWLAEPSHWPGRRLVVYGPAGSGKTHLLHLFAARHRAALLPALALRRLSPPPEAPALAVDDADTVPDPRALLHLLNVAAERRQPVLLAARSAPSTWQIDLPDLASRVRAITSVALGLPEDDLLKPLLARLLAERQLRVPEKVQAYLLARLPRTGGALREAAARLDRLSLAQGGTVGRALAARLVEDMTEQPADDTADVEQEALPL
jgi:chromosomal replication initiation ATPase DnaA